MLLLHLLFHITGGVVVFACLVRLMLGWPREADQYPIQTRRQLFVPFSRRWENGVRPEDLAALQRFRDKLGAATVAIVAFAYAEVGYYLASSMIWSFATPAP